MNPFRQLMQSPAAATSPPLGSWIMSASPIVAEAIGYAGFDWAVVDMEHSPLDLSNLVHLLQAVSGTPLVPITRVPWNDTVLVKRVLDAGAATLLFPFVQNASEARRAVAACRYPPEGVRGMAGMSRASRFGTRPDYFRNANADVSVIVQLETPEAVANLDAIAAVPGIEGIFLGPADLSGAMGLVGQLTHPDVMALMAQAAQRAIALGKWAGTVGGTAEVVRQYRAMGFNFVAVASDLGLLMRAAGDMVRDLRAEPAIAAITAPAATTTASQSGY